MRCPVGPRLRLSIRRNARHAAIARHFQTLGQCSLHAFGHTGDSHIGGCRIGAEATAMVNQCDGVSSFQPVRCSQVVHSLRRQPGPACKNCRCDYPTTESGTLSHVRNWDHQSIACSLRIRACGLRIPRHCLHATSYSACKVLRRTLRLCAQWPAQSGARGGPKALSPVLWPPVLLNPKCVRRVPPRRRSSTCWRGSGNRAGASSPSCS